jgi:hypothetical protein
MSTSDLVALLSSERLCLDCLARKIARRRADIVAALDALKATLRLSQEQALCSACAGVRITYKVLATGPA